MSCISAYRVKINEFVVPEKSNIGETVKLLCGVDTEETPDHQVHWFINDILIGYTPLSESTMRILRTSGLDAEVILKH